MRDTNNDWIIWIISIIAFLAGIWFSARPVQAAGNDNVPGSAGNVYTYTVHVENYNPEFAGQTRNYENQDYTYSGTLPLYGYMQSVSGGALTRFEFKVYNPDNFDFDSSLDTVVYTYSYKDGFVSSDELNGVFSNLTINAFPYSVLTTSIPLFTSEAAALAYYDHGDSSGLIVDYLPIPDISEAYDNNYIQLVDFKVDNVVNVSWSGISGTGSRDPYSGTEVNPDTTENSFVHITYGFSSFSAPGYLSIEKDVNTFVPVDDGGYSISMADILGLVSDEHYYLLYIKAVPYHYNNDNPQARLYKGVASYAYFDSDASLSWYDSVKNDITHASGRRGSIYLHDFYLTNVSCKASVLGRSVVSWHGTTRDDVVMFIPEKDTVVVVGYTVKLEDGNYKFFEVDTPTINSGSSTINYNKILNDCEKAGYVWDRKIVLTPYYKKGSALYVGEPSSIDLVTGRVINFGLDDDGSIKEEDVTDEVDSSLSLDAGNVVDYTKAFIGFLKGTVSAMGDFPQIVATVFSFLPAFYINALSFILFLLVILRILGR